MIFMSLYTASSLCKFRSCCNKCIKLFLSRKTTTVLLRLYSKLNSQALTLCVQMPVLIFALDGQTEEFHGNNAAGMFVLLILYRAFS